MHGWIIIFCQTWKRRKYLFSLKNKQICYQEHFELHDKIRTIGFFGIFWLNGKKDVKSLAQRNYDCIDDRSEETTTSTAAVTEAALNKHIHKETNRYNNDSNGVPRIVRVKVKKKMMWYLNLSSDETDTMLQ